MRKEFPIVGTLLAITIATATAQQPKPQPPPEMPADRTESLVLTGCLRPAESVMGQSEQTAGGTPNPMETVRVQGLYVLTDVEPAVNPRPPVPPGSPQPPAPAKPTNSAHNTYYVTAKDGSVKLADHLNHRIQIVGTLKVAETPKPAAGTSSPPAPAEAVAKPAGDKSSTVIVSEVTMLSAACSTLR